MNIFNNKVHQVNEEQIAQLTNVAYQAILERGFRGSFLELELSLWNAIRAALQPLSRGPELAVQRGAPLEAV